MKMHPIQIDTKESPRSILKKDFESQELPIKGGWGYSIADACIIDKNDPIVNPELPFSGIRIEKTFVDMRIKEEMVRLYSDGEAFTNIHYRLLKQNLIQDNGKSYDRLEYEITANVKTEKIIFTREFWFDITSFFGE